MLRRKAQSPLAGLASKVAVVVVAPLLLLLSGCAEEEITTYTARPESQPIGEPWTEIASPYEAASAELPRWEVPSDWRPVERQESARQATFAVDVAEAEETSSLEIAVTRFPGDVGGMLANVNRWRAQVGLGSLDEAELAEHVELFDTPGFEVYATRLDGAEHTILAAGLFEPFANHTWFVRSHVDRVHADALAEDFFRFVRSFERVGHSLQPTPDAPPELPNYDE